jgi:hypothetical protein
MDGMKPAEEYEIFYGTRKNNYQLETGVSVHDRIRSAVGL